MQNPKPAGSNIFEQMANIGQSVTPATSGGETLGAMLGSLGTPQTKTDVKRSQVEQTARAKAIALADQETLQTFAAARVNGNRLADDEIYQELRSAPYTTILEKYGPEVADNRNRILMAEREFGTALNDPRTDREVAADTGIAVGQGIWNLAGSIGALGAGLVSDELGAFASGLVEDGSKWAEEQKSSRFQEYKQAQDRMASLDRLDRAAEYEENLANGSLPNWVDTAQYWGQSASDAVSRVATDPALLGNFVAENIGTLIPSVGLARGAQALAKGTKLAGAAVPVSVALGESGAAYSGSVNRVMEMTPEELAANSEDYRRLISEGLSHEQAQIEVATDAGMMAAALQAPLAAAAGKFVEKFETAPMASGSLRDVADDIGRQVLEEGFQEGTGQFNQNLGIQTFADETQTLDEGVAEGAALGALGGAAVTGVVKAPGLAGNAASEAMRRVVGGMNDRAEAKAAAEDAANPVGNANTQSRLKSIDETLSRAANTLAQSSATTSPDPTASPEVPVQEAELASRIMSVAFLDQSEADRMPEGVRKMFLGDARLPDGMNIRRGEAMVEVLNEMQNASPQVRKEAALWLNEQVNRLGSLQGLDLSNLTNEVREDLVQVIQASNEVVSNATVKAALEEASNLTQEDLGPLPEITPENANTPEVQKAVGNTVALAQANPAGVNPKFIDTILEQTVSGGLNLTTVVQNQLRLAKHIAETLQGVEAKKETLIAGAKNEGAGRGKKSVAQVREEILSKGKNNDLNQFGLVRHMTEIMVADGQGDTRKVQDLMDNLRKFAEGMQNKVKAANESIGIADTSSNAVSYKTWNGSKWVDGKIYVFAGSNNSVLTGRAVAEDAASVADLYDGLLQRMGDRVQGSPVARVEPDALIGGASNLPAAEGNPEADSAPTKERKIRKDAVVKTEESLIDQNESDPVKPVAADVVSTQPEKEPQDAGRAEPAPEPAGEPEADRTADTEAQTEEGKGSAQEKAGRVESRDKGADPQSEPASAEEASQDGEQEGSAGSSQDDVTPDDEGTEVTFDNLATNSKGISRVGRAYRFLTTRSPFLALTSPARVVMEQLKDHVEGKARLPVSMNLSSEQAKTWGEDILGEGAKLILDRMNARLNQNQKGVGSGKITPNEALAQGLDPTGWAEGKALNLVDPSTGKYEPRLQQLAIMAGIHWVLNQTLNPNPKPEDVARMFGVDIAEVDNTLMQMARTGMSTRLAKESLAKTILDFWGAEINPEAPLSDSMGIAQGMAVEVLVSMRDIFVTYEREADSIANGKVKKEYFPITLSSEKTKSAVERLGSSTDLLGELMLPGSEKAYYIDDDLPPPLKSTQKRNFLSQLGQKIMRVLDRHQKIEFKRNGPFVDLLKALDQETMFELLGYQEINESNTNRSHRKSLEGKNTQIEMSWRGVMSHMERLEAKASEKGVSVDELITRFPWYMVSNERIHAGGFNPQSDKLMREAVVSTTSTLDMTDSQQESLFWVTVGQSTGLIKTEEIFENADEQKWVSDSGDAHVITAAKVQEAVDKRFGPAVQALVSWLQNGEMTSEEKATFVATVKGPKFSPKVLHALLSVARFYAAGENELKSFQHNLSLEADGKTDGPMAAIVNWSTGLFTPQELQNQRRGGFFLGQLGQTLNEQKRKNVGDLYEVGAKNTSEMLQLLQRTIKKGSETKKVAEQMHRLMRLTSAFSPDLVYDAEKREVVKVERGFLKNPLTITIYGSSANGIAGKLVREITDGIYEAMTRLEQLRSDLQDPSLTLKNLPEFAGYPKIEQDLAALATTGVIRWKDKKTGERKWGVVNTDRNGKTASLPRKMGRDYTLSPEALEMMRANMLHLVVTPMRHAINSVVGNSMDNLRVFQEATQFMSETMIDRFQKEVKKQLEEKRKAGELEGGEFLSQKDYDAIFKEMSKFGAIIAPIDSLNHHLNLSTSENTPSGHTFSGGLDREFVGEATLPGPSTAGVAAMPLMTISRGDATMMVNYFAAQDPDMRVLPVFDGLEMPADGISSISEKINKAVAEAWLEENGAVDMRDSFRDFMQQGLTPEEKKTANEILPRLEEIALETQARKAVMRRVNYSMDHMASGRVPHNNEGEVFDYDPAAADYDVKLAEWLNTLLEEERANLAGEAQARAAQTGVERDNPVFLDMVNQVGAPVGDMGVTRLTMKNMARVLQTVGAKGGASAEKMNVFKLLKPLLPDFTFLVGSKADLEAYAAHRFGVKGQAVDLGQIDFKNGVIYVASGSVETTLHEMLHAVTMKLVLAYYEDPASLTEPQRAAIQNLEALMQQFQGLDFTETTEASLEVGAETLSVATMVQRQIASLALSGDNLSKAKALNEFMAWTLTNQDLIQTLQKTRTRVKSQSFVKGLLQDLVEIVRKSMAEVRKLLGFGSEVPMDMFSNIAFNTGMLVYGQANAQPGVLVEPVGTVLQQRVGLPVDARIDALMARFQKKVGAHLEKLLETEGPGKVATEERLIAQYTDAALNIVSANFWTLDPQQKQAFRVIQQSFATASQFDSAALTRAEKLFEHVTSQLTPESFVQDPTNPNDVIRSERMYEALMGARGYSVRGQKSNLLATFVALSQVHPGFRTFLKSIALPKAMKVNFSSADEMLTSFAEKSMDTLERALSGDKKSNQNSLQSLDDLAQTLSMVRRDEQTQIEQMASSLLDRADSKGAALLAQGADKLTRMADAMLLQQQRGIRKEVQKAVAESAKVVAGLMDANRGEALATSAVSLVNQMNKAPRFLTELMNDIIGMTNENERVLGLVNRVKYAVSKLRQEYRTETPKILAKQFTKKLSDQEWSALHLALGRTDLVALVTTMGMRDAITMLTDKKAREKKGQELQEFLKKTMPRVSSFYDEQAQNLARFMVTGEIDSETRVFHRNAEAIARLLGTGMQGTDQIEVIEALDQLVTLYAIEMLDQGTVDKVQELVKTESNGVEFAAYYLQALHAQEKTRGADDVARFNGYKGHIPMEIPDGASLIVADDADMKILEAKGYTRIGKYEGTGLELGSRGYYYSAVSGRNTFSQGVMQTVHSSAFGVDPRTGFSVGGTTGGVIQGRAVATLERKLASTQTLGKEVLMPVFDQDGNVVAYERSLAPDMVQRLRRNTHLGEMLGAWAGRQTEEAMALDFNHQLVDRTHEVYKEGMKSGRAKEFVNLADISLTDPILIDAWKMIPKETKDYIGQVFGPGEFWVRKDMVNATLGYRMPSVSDFWTGLSRWDPKTQKAFVDTASKLFGKNTFRYLVTAEKALQTGVSMAKHMIVVSSIIVPVSNFASNFVQLTLRGVPVRNIVKGVSSKLLEIDLHLKHLDRKVEIRALMARYSTDPVMTRRLETELQSLEDADRRMSIWPLIEAGEFSTISEGLTDLDGALTEGKWADRMAALAERIPAKFGTVGRYAAITRDTALFQGMSRATQYGDFLARAVLYDHRRNQGATQEEALRSVTEEFVNYNFLPGRSMSYAESMGMIWFSAYKLRSMKVALNIARENPVRALLMTVNPLGYNVPGVDIGSPLSDNLASVIADGRLPYSIGPGMLFRAPEMNPWVNILN